MLNSSSTTFNNFPILYEDNNIVFSQLSEDTNPFAYYDNIQSPMFYYDVENYVEYLSNHELMMVQQQEPLQATNGSPITTTDDSSIMENNNMELLSNDNNNNNNNINNSNNNNGGVVLNKPSMTRGSSKRRTSKKDRHSKIRTAHGLRDRRMRLSLEVAGSFFKLQDMLGFDKGSRTVEWLLKNSKEAIDKLVQSKNGSVSGLTKCTMSSTSDNCEGDSIVVEQKKANNTNNNNNNNNNNNIKNSINNTNNKGKNDVGCVTKDAKNNNNYNYNNRKIIKEKRLRTTKEAMKRARDKARKRTLEKMFRGFMDDAKDSYSMNYNSGNWSPSTNFSTYQNGDICQSGKLINTLN